MTVMSRLDRITSDPAVCHGQPTIRGLRYPVENLLELLASGMTIEEVVDDHPDLDRDDLLAALEFGALASGLRRVVPARLSVKFLVATGNISNIDLLALFERHMDDITDALNDARFVELRPDRLIIHG